MEKITWQKDMQRHHDILYDKPLYQRYQRSMYQSTNVKDIKFKISKNNTFSLRSLTV